MSIVNTGQHTFTVKREPIEVTSISRPDPAWFVIDRKGHLHQWWEERPFRPADTYSPSKRYIVPSVEAIFVGMEWIGDEFDGEEIAVYELRCRKCGEVIKPRYKADDSRQYVPGLRHLYVDDRPVTLEEFKRIAIEEGIPASAFEGLESSE